MHPFLMLFTDQLIQGFVAKLPIVLTCPQPSEIPQNPKTWGDHIRKRRIETGLFQKEVAPIWGVDECSVYNWENNRGNPGLKHIPKTIEFLGYIPELFTVETLGEKLKRYRKLLGINQDNFARQLGIDPTTLSRLERDENKPSGKIKKRIEIFFTGDLRIWGNMIFP